MVSKASQQFINEIFACENCAKTPTGVKLCPTHQKRWNDKRWGKRNETELRNTKLKNQAQTIIQIDENIQQEYANAKKRKGSPHAESYLSQLQNEEWVRLVDAEKHTSNAVEKALIKQMKQFQELYDSFPMNIEEVEQEHDRIVTVYKLGSEGQFRAWLRKFRYAIRGRDP